VNLRFVIAYDGTAFRGWQSQPGGGTAQDALEEAVARIVGQRITVHGSGRTDAGVHALAQMAHIEIPDARFQGMGTLREPGRWVAALNDALPAELRVLKATRAPADFHARFSATGKIYRYQIWHGAVLPPLLFKRAWHLYGKLDREILKELCLMIEGTHDFRGFCADHGSLPKETVRTLRRVSLKARGPALSVTLEGNGFLYRMVRMLVGGMVRVAQGKEAIEIFRQRLHAGKPWPTPAMAPAEGLYLLKVLYGGEKKGMPRLDP